jgi:hypothetical protein
MTRDLDGKRDRSFNVYRTEARQRHYWGARCNEYEAGCAACTAWRIYDARQAETAAREAHRLWCASPKDGNGASPAF